MELNRTTLLTLLLIFIKGQLQKCKLFFIMLCWQNVKLERNCEGSAAPGQSTALQRNTCYSYLVIYPQRQQLQLCCYLKMINYLLCETNVKFIVSSFYVVIQTLTVISHKNKTVWPTKTATLINQLCAADNNSTQSVLSEKSCSWSSCCRHDKNMLSVTGFHSL